MGGRGGSDRAMARVKEKGEGEGEAGYIFQGMCCVLL